MNSNNSSRYAIIRDELEGTRKSFLELLDEIPDRDFERLLPGEVWTAKQEMMHITQLLSVLPNGIKKAYAGRNRSLLSFVPTDIRSWINGYIVIPFISKGATRDSIASSYNQAHTNLLHLLEKLPDKAWEKGTNYPSQFRTVEQMAHRPSEHYKVHADHIKSILGIT
jgi:hypothetical protein